MVKELTNHISERPMRTGQWRWIWALLLSGALLYAAAHTLLQKLLATWSKEQVEIAVGANLRRPVKFTTLDWSIGLGGIMVNTKSIEIDETDGRPFVLAGPGEISVALLPLLQRKEIDVTSLTFHNPQIWARKLPDGHWNFSDLANIPAFQSLHRVEITSGDLHVVDENDSSANVELSDIQGTLNRAFDHRKWPFSLSLHLKRPTYTTNITVHGISNGGPDSWVANEQSFDVKVESLHARDFRGLISTSSNSTSVFGADGPIDLQLTGSGTPNALTSAKVWLKTDTFTFSADRVENLGPLPFLPNRNGEIPPFDHTELHLTNAQLAMNGLAPTLAKMNGTMHLTKDTAQFEKLSGLFGQGSFATSGTISNSQAVALTCHAANMSLAEIKAAINFLKINVPAAALRQPVEGTIKAADLSVAGTSQHPQVKLAAVPGVIYFAPKGSARLFQLNGGQIKYDGEQATLTNVSGQLAHRGTFSMDGTYPVAGKGEINLRFTSRDIDLNDVKGLAKELNLERSLIDTKQFDQNAWAGSLKSATGEIHGTTKKLAVSLTVTPASITFQPVGQLRMFELTGGQLSLSGNTCSFSNTSGRLGSGRFTLNGTAPVDTTGVAPLELQVNADNMDLARVRSTLTAMRVQSSLLADQTVSGTIKKVALQLKGPASQPAITMTASPDNLRYEPLGPTQSMHFKSGTATLANDCLTLQNVEVSTPKSKLKTSLLLKAVSKSPALVQFSFDTQGLDLADMQRFLSTARTPKQIREQYQKSMKQLSIDSASGTVTGSCSWRNDTNAKLACKLSLEAVALKIYDYSISNLKVKMVTNGSSLHLDHLSGLFGRSPFQGSGYINDCTDQSRSSWHLALSTQLAESELNALIEHEKSAGQDIRVDQAVPVSLQISGSDRKLTAQFTSAIAAGSKFAFVGPFGTIAKPLGQPASASGTVVLEERKISLDADTKCGAAIVALKGSYLMPSTNDRSPTVALTLEMPNPILAQNLIPFLPAHTIDRGLSTITGALSGKIELKGSSDSPAVRGAIKISDICVPAYKLSNVSGTISSNDWVTGNSSSSTDRQSTPFEVSIDSMTLNKLPVRNIKGKLLAAYWQNPAGEKKRTISLRDLTADLAKGQLKLRGGVLQERLEFGGRADLLGVDANELFTELFDSPNEITGTLQAHISFRANLTQSKNVYDTLEIPKADPARGQMGSSYKVENGHVARFSLLQRRITQANFIKGGITGFNLNNLIESVAPVRNGDFSTIEGTFWLEPHLVLKFNDAHFIGNELTLRAGGTVNFPKKFMSLKVAGNIPRNSTRGFLGALGPRLSIQGLASTLDGLPLLPKIFTLDKRPRTFAFNIGCALEPPTAITQAITRSFHWLPNAPEATPHPALDISSSNESPTPIM